MTRIVDLKTAFATTGAVLGISATVFSGAVAYGQSSLRLDLAEQRDEKHERELAAVKTELYDLKNRFGVVEAGQTRIELGQKSLESAILQSIEEQRKRRRP